MKINFALLLFFICHSLSAQPGIKKTNTPSSLRYDDICFINPDTGWTINGSGEIYKTLDGGIVWNKIFSGGKYLRSIEFIDEQVGFCGSLATSVYKTTDGGSNWVDISPQFDPRVKGICGLAIPDKNTIYGCGIYSSPAYMIKSVDAGTSWQFIDMSTYATALVEIYFIDSNKGFVAGKGLNEEGIILYTGDGGATWETVYQTTGFAEYVWKIQNLDNTHYFASIQGNISQNPKTRILKSDDGGKVWKETIVSDNPDNSIQMVGFLTPLHGWVGGREYLFETTDGGDTWTPYLTYGIYNRFLKINDHKAFLTGERVYYYDSLNVSTNDPRPVKAESSKLIVTPNPTSGNLKINIDLISHSIANIAIYDQSGKKIKSICNEIKSRGQHQFTMDLSSFSPQVFTVVLLTNEGHYFEKVLLTR